MITQLTYRILGPLLALLQVVALTLPGHASPRPLNIALIGDSITRGVIADKSLGSMAQPGEYLLATQLLLGGPTVDFVPEKEGVLNWSLMQQNAFLARDSLAAVQGQSPYSVTSNLETRGIKTRVLNVAQLGGSYRTADSQVALLRATLDADPALKPDEIDVVVVDLGRIDFSLFSEIPDFKSQVDQFFTRLLQTIPHSRFLVTRIASIPQILDRPDRVGLRFIGGLEVTCGQIFRGGRIAVKTRLIPGQDNSPYIGKAMDRWQTMNQTIADKVDSLGRQGVTIQMVDTIPDRAPEEWDQVLASDCIHLNQVGQSQIAGAYLSAIDEILTRPATQDAPPPEATVPHWTAEADQAWEDYIKTVELDKLQDQCRPRIIREKPSAPAYKGIAVLYHGFTACPQQFFELAEDLSAQGYTVVLPLLPGHGRKWTEVNGQKVDDLSQFPQGILSLPYSYQESYVNLAAQMNLLAAKVQGERVIAGLSLGGSLVSITTMLRSDLWDRQLILSPLYEIGPTAMRTLLGTISNTQRQLSQLLRVWDPILDKDLGWGPGCESERNPAFVLAYGRRELRAGICQFKVTHVGGANQLGYDAWETIRPTLITTQVIAVAQDPVINKKLVFNSVGRLRSESLKVPPFRTERRFDQHPAIRVCYLPSDNQVCKENLQKPIDLQEKPCINHSLLSRFDMPQQNKYWITPLNQKITRFLTAGEFLGTDPRERAHGDPLCSGF